MFTRLALITGKSVIGLTNTFNLGSGSTWPGHIALKINKNFIKNVLKKSNTKIILVTGTNGKTTTSRLVTSIIRENKKTYLQNKAGANLLNGLSSAIVLGSNWDGKLTKDYLIFEADEYALPEILKNVNPDYIICLNLFRDQLDRYGEVDSIAKRWSSAFSKLNENTKLILNADDAQIAYLAKNTKAKTFFFGLNEKNNRTKPVHGADTTRCPICFAELEFKSVYFSHIGIWKCTKCEFNRPKLDLEKLPNYPLEGTYNKYNALAATLLGIEEEISPSICQKAFSSFTPAFGRQETLKYKDRNIRIFLSKNPTSFNESLSTINEKNAENLLILLNDRIPDGLDVSWIWDIDFENLIKKNMNIGISGDRLYDMGLRLKYAEKYTHLIPNPEHALNTMIEKIGKNETLYILPNYSAMLDIRKIITGKKLL